MDLKHKIHFNSITFKILFYLIIINIIVILSISSIQIIFDYYKEKKNINNLYEFITNSYLPILSLSAYKLDDNEITLLISGLNNNDYVDYIEVKVFTGKSDYIISEGGKNIKNVKKKEFPLEYLWKDTIRVVGTLTVKTDFNSIILTILKRALYTLLLNTIMILLVSIGIFFIVNKYLITHLIMIARYLQQIDMDFSVEKLQLVRKSKPDYDDELGLVVNAINNMYDKIKIGVKKYRIAEEEISRALKEKDVLLQEIHHRVKNNLNNISSLLKLKMMNISNEEMKNILTDSVEKIYSMGLVHELLYKSNDFSKIDFDVYITNLIDNLSFAYQIKERDITINVQTEKIHLSINNAIPCGLLINELLTNCFKHAFKDKSRGVVEISFSYEKDYYRLLIKDNGIGFLPDFEHKHSFGIELIKHLVIGTHTNN